MRLYFYNGQSTNYSVTQDGRVMNNNTNCYLKGQKNKTNGYWSVNITVPGDKKRLYIHRMVAETFKPNPNSKYLEVNHIDGDKDNNHIDNLEWLTPIENKEHAKENNLNSSKRVYCFDDNLKLVVSYRSIMDAYRITGHSTAQISSACNMEPKVKSYGYYWSFNENPTFSIKVVGSGKEKPVCQYDLNGVLLNVYPSMSEAARQLNCARNHIGSACNGRIKSYKGFIWKYQDKDIV